MEDTVRLRTTSTSSPSVIAWDYVLCLEKSYHIQHSDLETPWKSMQELMLLCAALNSRSGPVLLPT